MYFYMSCFSIYSSILFDLCQDSSESVRLLSVAVSVFGPRKILQELFVCNQAHSSSGSRDEQFTAEQFLKMFGETFVPWCLHGDNCSTSARLDLLLALLDDEYFSEQWGAVITYATNLEPSGAMAEYQGSSCIEMLAMLLEKARDEIAKRKAENPSSRKGAKPEHWHHGHIEQAAVAVARTLPPFGASDANFLWYVNQDFNMIVSSGLAPNQDLTP